MGVEFDITIVSDLHGHFPELPGGDLLILGGDYTARDTEEEWIQFLEWLKIQKYEKIICIAGNHDGLLSNIDRALRVFPPENSNYWKGIDSEFLMNNSTSFYGIKIWGTPMSLHFDEINPKCAHFTRTEEELKAQFAKIPDDTDIIISHGPMKYCLDQVLRFDRGVIESTGSYALREAVDRVKPKLLVTGHIHEAYGYVLYKHEGPNTRCINASYVNEHYKPVNEPIRIKWTSKGISPWQDRESKT